MRVGGLAICWLLVGCASISGLNEFELDDGTGGAAVGGDPTPGSGGTDGTGGAELGGAGGVGGRGGSVADGGNGGMGGEAIGGGGDGGSAPCLSPADVYLDDRCYRVETTNVSYDDAETDCQGIAADSHLAALSTMQEFNDVASALAGMGLNGLWIGADDRVTEGTFVWLNGERWTYTPMMAPWAPSEPNNDNEEDCVELVLGNAHLNDNTCTNMQHYLCEYPAS